MSGIDRLIVDHSPDSVGYRTLGDMGTIFGGLTGKSKSDFVRGNARFISYVNVFNNIATDVEASDFVTIGAGERQRRLQRGDVLFTGSSETADEVGMTSVITVDVQDPLYLNSFCIGFRPNDPNLFNPEFCKYLFRSSDVRKKIVRTASGVTRFNISKRRLSNVEIPVPTLDIQDTVVAILDGFTKLQAELQAELQARVFQFRHYRDALLSFDSGRVRTKALGEVGHFTRGRRFVKEDYAADGVDCIHYGDIYTRYGTSAQEAVSHVRADLAPSLRFAKTGDVVIATVGETVEDVGKAVAWLGKGDVAVHDDCFAFRHDQNPKFISYCFQTAALNAEKNKFVARGKVKRLSGESLAKLRIPVPPLDEQARIVGILDKFDALVNDLSSGLPAEINARRQQYQHYRDRLLTFKMAA
jgi:type I restriction enzyme S subunit